MLMGEKKGGFSKAVPTYILTDECITSKNCEEDEVETEKTYIFKAEMLDHFLTVLGAI